MGKLIALILLVALSAQVFGQVPWSPSDTDKGHAEQTFRDYLKALAEARFDDAYALLTPGMQSLMSLDQWRDSENEFSRVSGGSPRYGNIRATWYKDPAGAPLPGVYVAFDLDCRYENINRCHQVLMLHQQADASFRVMRHERNFMDKTNEAAIRQREPGAQPQ